jgi:hypothetical protein
MTSRRTPPDSFTDRERLLNEARDELDAARILIAGLGKGGSLACVHLVRAAAILAHVTESLERAEILSERPSEDIISDEFSPPGLSEPLLIEWREQITTVVDRAGAPPTGHGTVAKQIDRSARTVHDLLERSLRWNEREIRARFFPDGWPTRLLWWIAGGVVLCAVAAIAILSAGDHEVRPRPTAARPTAREASEATLSELSSPKPQGTRWDAPDNIIIPHEPSHLLVTIGDVSHAATLEISLDNNDRYRIEFVTDGSVIAEASVGPTKEPGGLVVYRLAVPQEAADTGFDAIRIVAIEGDDHRSVGHVILGS